MRVFIAAIPLFDENMAVQAYRLCDRSGDNTMGINSGFRGMGQAFQSPGLSLVEKVGIEPFAGDKPLLAEINKVQLLTGMPIGMKIEPSRLVCLFPGDMPVEADVWDRCEALRYAGYMMAFNGFPTGGTKNPLIRFASYIILHYGDKKLEERYNILALHAPHTKVIISGIPDTTAHKKMMSQYQGLYSGKFYNEPITAGETDIAPVKVNALQLLNQVNQPDFDLSDIVNIIERDPALSISLLRFINSSVVGLRREVNSIASAIAILGQNEVRRWATVAISVNLSQDRPGEITKLSLVRAKFAENLAGAFELGVFQPALFMAGLFSLLDVILQKPMAEAIKEVAIDKNVMEALVNKAGKLYPVLEMIYAYEHADWDGVSILMIKNQTDVDTVSKAFVDALVWYSRLLESIDAPV